MNALITVSMLAMGSWLWWVIAALFVIAGLVIGFTARKLVRRLSGRYEWLTRNRGWFLLPVCAVFFVWLPLTYHYPMAYVPYGFLATVVASIIILY